MIVMLIIENRKMKKHLLLSVCSEKLANDIAIHNDIEEDVLETVLLEINDLILSPKKLQTLDEFRKMLCILSCNNLIRIIHNQTPKQIVNDSLSNLLDTFGSNHKDEIHKLFRGIDSKTYRTFVVTYQDNNRIVCSSIIVEHQFKSSNGKIVITWELLWICCSDKKKGFGSKTWKDITNLAAMRRIDGILVPSTNKALPFWLKRNSKECAINKTIIAQEIRKEEKLLIQSNGYKVSESPCTNIVNLYRESKIKPFRGSPYRWMPDEANHLWFIPSKKAIF